MNELSTAADRPDSTATSAAGRASVLFTGLCWVQGLYYLFTGVWPLVSLDTFQAVTGPKEDLWLVQTVGVLVTVIGLVLLLAAWRRRASAEVALLAVGCAVALAGVDIVFVTRDVIARIYLLDAGAEGVLLAGWALALARGR